MTERRSVATLWLGPELSFLEILSLRSFAAAGQKVTLYLYDELKNLPDEIEVRDAREVMDEAFVQEHWGRSRLQDPRIHADIFRILMLRKTSHIWVDTDVFAVRSHMTSHGYLLSVRKAGFVPNHVIALPQDSDALRKLEDFVSRQGEIPPWWNADKVAAYSADHHDASFETMPVGVTGPEAFGYFLSQTGEISHACPFRQLNPILARQTVGMLEVPSPFDMDDIFQDTVSIHYYATGLRRRLVKSYGVPPNGSFIDLLCGRVDLDPAQFPVLHRDDKQGVKKFRKYNRPSKP